MPPSLSLSLSLPSEEVDNFADGSVDGDDDNGDVDEDDEGTR